MGRDYCTVNEFYAESRHLRTSRATKPIRCCETGRVIEAGEHYWKCSGKTEGDFWTVYQSEAAYRFARFLNKVGQADFDGCDIMFGGVSDAVFERTRFDIQNEPGDPAQIAAQALLDEWGRVRMGVITRPGV